MQRDFVAGAFGNVHAEVNRVGRPGRNQMHVHHGPGGPCIALVDAIAVRIHLQRAIEVRAFLHRAFAVVLDASTPEYGLALVVSAFQFEPGIVGVHRAAGKEVSDFLGADHDIHAYRHLLGGRSPVRGSAAR